MIGRVDRVDEETDGSLSVLDYKTGEPPDEVDPRQFYLYAVMVEAQVQRRVSRGSFWYLDEGRRVSIDIDEEGKARAVADARRIAQELGAAQEFPPNIGRRCGYCPYLSVCEYKAEITRRREAEGW